jgi:hypothetical protein
MVGLFFLSVATINDILSLLTPSFLPIARPFICFPAQVPAAFLVNIYLFVATFDNP